MKKKPKRGWHVVKPSAKWGCRGGRACGAIPMRAYVTWRRDGSTIEKRYCIRHARLHGCTK